MRPPNAPPGLPHHPVPALRGPASAYIRTGMRVTISLHCCADTLAKPRGRALVDKRLYLPAAWCADAPRCAAARVPTAQQRYRAKTELALEMVVQAQARGHLEAQWVAADAAFGMSPACRDGLAAAGLWYVLDVSAQMTVWPQTPTWSDPPCQGRGRPRTYRCSAERARATSQRRPGAEGWVLYRQNLDGSEPRYCLSNAPAETPLETLAGVGGSRWHIETACETSKSDVGMDEYETRTWPGWHHHIAMGLLASAFLLSLQQAWWKTCPTSRVRKCIGWCGKSCPGPGVDRMS